MIGNSTMTSLKVNLDFCRLCVWTWLASRNQGRLDVMNSPLCCELALLIGSHEGGSQAEGTQA